MENILVELCSVEWLLIATTSLIFVWLTMENRGALIVILSSFPTGCQLKDYLGRKGNYFLWFQKKKPKGLGVKYQTVCCLVSDLISLCAALSTL